MSVPAKAMKPAASVEAIKSSTFGPSALVTPANGITLARVLAAPVLIAIVAASGPGWAPFALAIAIGVTDAFDGWLARRQGVTRSGAFLDPLADKLAVVGSLFAIAGRGEISFIPVALIAGRELIMSVYRSVLGRRGISIPARLLAKVKTFVQGIAVLLCLAPSTASHPVVLSSGIWVAVGFTFVTGAQYVFDGARKLRKGESAPVKPTASEILAG